LVPGSPGGPTGKCKPRATKNPRFISGFDLFGFCGCDNALRGGTLENFIL
jgi:hypothetical protein